MVHVETKAMLRFGCQRLGPDCALATDAADRVPYQDHIEGTSRVPAGEGRLKSTALRHPEVSDNEALRSAEREWSYGDQAG